MLQNFGTHLEGEEKLVFLKQTTAGIPAEREGSKSVITSDTPTSKEQTKQRSDTDMHKPLVSIGDKISMASVVVGTYL